MSHYKDNTIGAISRYDAEYMKYYTGLDVKLVPSYSGFYMQQKYNPQNATYLIFTVHRENHPFISAVKKVLASVDIKSEFVYNVYNFYKAEDLVNHPAVISLPYSVMSFRFTELYSLGIPLFVPSPKYFLENHGMGHDRTSTSEPYCDKDPNLEEKMRPNIDLGYSEHLYSPNIEMNQDPEAEMYWMQYADFYDWPHITYFDSINHLKDLLLNADLKTIHEKMLEELKLRKLKVTQAWCDISNRISDRKVNYKNTIHKPYKQTHSINSRYFCINKFCM